MRQEYGRLLSQHTSLKIGGPAFCWLEPEDLEDLLESIKLAETNNKSLTLFGNGSNILVQDKGFDGVVVNLGKGFDCIEREEEDVLKLGSAGSISRLVRKTAEWGLGGCEFLAGIPGSFGGAVFMNAGVRDVASIEKLREIKDIIVDVDVLDLKDKKKKNLKRDEIFFMYRSSALEGKCILGARVRLQKDEAELINNRIDEFLKKRQWIKDLRFPSAGSIFKNPDSGNPAGKLIERCGLKGKRIGGAEFSGTHANFIVNIGGATSKDVMDLIDLARTSVKKKFRLELELELRII